MKKIFLLSVITAFLLSCNKLTEKNIVGTWNPVEFKVDGASQPIFPNTYIEFTESGSVLYYTAGVLDSYDFYSIQDNGSVLSIDGTNYDVEKKGKTMTLTYTGSNTEELTLEKQ